MTRVTKGGLVRSIIEAEAEAMTKRMIDIVFARNGFEQATPKDSTKAYEVLMSRAFGAPKQVVETVQTQVLPGDNEPLTLEQMRALERVLSGIIDGTDITITPVIKLLPE